MKLSMKIFIFLYRLYLENFIHSLLKDLDIIVFINLNYKNLHCYFNDNIPWNIHTCNAFFIGYIYNFIFKIVNCIIMYTYHKYI